jgi:hypothetical protein
MTSKRKVRGPKEFFILWNPQSDYPPNKRFNTLAEAERVATECVQKWHESVYTMRVVSETVPAPQVMVTRYRKVYGK